MFVGLVVGVWVVGSGGLLTLGEGVVGKEFFEDGVVVNIEDGVVVMGWVVEDGVVVIDDGV